MSWKPGPLPPDTYGWGGVTTERDLIGFFFADFCGDHVKLCPGDRVITADQVVMFDNSLTLPPNRTGRAPTPGEAP